RAYNDAGSFVDDIRALKPGVTNRLFHGDEAPADTSLHDAARLAWNHRLPFEVRSAVDLAAETEFGVFLRVDDARLGLAQSGQHFLAIVADRGHDTHPRDDHASHCQTFLGIVVPLLTHAEPAHGGIEAPSQGRRLLPGFK